MALCSKTDERIPGFAGNTIKQKKVNGNLNLNLVLRNLPNEIKDNK